VACGTGSNLKRAEQSYARGEYSDAAKRYRKVYTSLRAADREKRADVAYKMATCYRLTSNNLRAKSAYTNAIRYGCTDSTALFYLAEALRGNGEYASAAKCYTDYLKLSPDDPLALNGLASCNLAQQMKSRPTRYRVKREQILLSVRADYSPMFAGQDADVLYFTSTRGEKKGTVINGITGMKDTDIYTSRRDGTGRWRKPEPLDSLINSEWEEGACSFSPDGRTMYFTRCRTSQSADVYAEIYTSARADGAWSKPVRCVIIGDTLSTVAHPAVSPDGRYLYFVSDMPGGMGGLDIWRMSIADGKPGYVDNAGPDINTAGREMFPTFSPDGTLYFSSDGHPGMGGLDIFSARPDSVSGRWHVENMGTPINSQADDFGMTFNPHRQNEGFFSSNRNDSRGWDHLYSFYLPDVHCTVSGVVTDNEGEPLAEAVVTIVGDDGSYNKLNTRSDGTFSHQLQSGHSYAMLAASLGHLNASRELTTEPSDTDHDYSVSLSLPSISRPAVVENIYYEFGSADITLASGAAIDELAGLLRQNPGITIELSSHCDYKGTDEYNEHLSQQRAEAVVARLVAKGISSDRLTARGYGKSRPKVADRSVCRKASFLVVGTALTEDYIKTLTAEQQEVCNSINRRTEFRVLRTNYGQQ
jgi:outer membrane protein OmpA-like peptidoglycan-associated protein